MRVALLPTPGDPFLLDYWLRNYEQVWAGEVDRLVVLVNGQQDPGILAYLVERVAGLPHAELMTLPIRMDHGRALGLLYDATAEDRVLFCEDDALVREPGAIAQHFDRLAEYDVVGSPRGGYSHEIEEACRAKWGDPFGDVETGYGLWPAFLFANRATLDQTDRHFGARSWEIGETVSGLGLVARELLSADTMAAVAFQLWDRARVLEVAQHRISNGNTAGPWFHIGSLSAGYGNAFADDAGTLAPFNADSRGWEWERRASWWERFWRAGTFLPEHRARYRAALDEFIDRAGLDRGGITLAGELADSLITWDEGRRG